MPKHDTEDKEEVDAIVAVLEAWTAATDPAELEAARSIGHPIAKRVEMLRLLAVAKERVRKEQG